MDPAGLAAHIEDPSLLCYDVDHGGLGRQAIICLILTESFCLETKKKPYLPGKTLQG